MSATTHEQIEKELEEARQAHSETKQSIHAALVQLQKHLDEQEIHWVRGYVKSLVKVWDPKQTTLL